MSLEAQGIKLFWRDIPGFCRDIPEAAEKFEKKMFGFNFWPLEREKEHKPRDFRGARVSSTRRGGGRKVHSLPQKFVFLGFSREGSKLGCAGNLAGMCRNPGGVQKVCANKVHAHFVVPYPSVGKKNTSSDNSWLPNSLLILQSWKAVGDMGDLGKNRSPPHHVRPSFSCSVLGIFAKKKCLNHRRT